VTHFAAPRGRILRALIPLVVLVGLCAAPAARAELYQVSQYGYSLDLPEGWKEKGAADAARLSFADPAGTAFLQVTVVEHEPAMTADQMEGELHRQMAAEGEGGSFTFSGRDAYLSEVVFSSGGRQLHGYILVVKKLTGEAGGGMVDAVLIAFAPADAFPRVRDSLLSALDSLSPGPDAALEPGPVSQRSAPYPSRAPRAVPIAFRGQTVTVSIGQGEREASQALVEREARLLAGYKAGQVEAWTRFYRMIYRDSYRRMDGLAAELQAALSSQGVSRRDAPLALLAWIQGYQYKRTGTLSDFLSPLSSVASAAGDCDSRAMLYDLILDHMGIDAILLVSVRFSHALAGVLLDRPGAVFAFQGRKYLVAEMTEKVDIGLIAKDMADGSAWIPMRLKN
jgi:hypothetical protein